MTNPLHLSYDTFYFDGMRLRQKAGEAIDIHLSQDNVPYDLRHLLPYAEFWGIADDSYRIELVKLAPNDIWKSFRASILPFEELLLNWLSGPDSLSRPLSQEYIAFSFMLQAYDYYKDLGT